LRWSKHLFPSCLDLVTSTLTVFLASTSSKHEHLCCDPAILMASRGVINAFFNRAFVPAVPRPVESHVYGLASAPKSFIHASEHTKTDDLTCTSASTVLINRSRSRSASRYMCARSKTDRKAVPCNPLAKGEGRDCHCGFARHLSC
jgi:hypothetical protein